MLQEIISDIEKDVEKLSLYSNEEDFIDEGFQQWCAQGEYCDNSVDLSYFYNAIKAIELDPEFSYKLRFVFNMYIRGSL